MHFSLTSAPGKKAASTNPRKNRVSKAPTKLRSGEIEWKLITLTYFFATPSIPSKIR